MFICQAGRRSTIRVLQFRCHKHQTSLGGCWLRPNKNPSRIVSRLSPTLYHKSRIQCQKGLGPKRSAPCKLASDSVAVDKSALAIQASHKHAPVNSASCNSANASFAEHSFAPERSVCFSRTRNSAFPKFRRIFPACACEIRVNKIGSSEITSAQIQLKPSLSFNVQVFPKCGCRSRPRWLGRLPLVAVLCVAAQHLCQNRAMLLLSSTGLRTNAQKICMTCT